MANAKLHVLTAPKSRFFKPGYSAVLLVAMVMLSACATTGKGPPDISSRAQARWDALLANDLDTAYGFYSPGYRSVHSRVDFEIRLRTRRVAWISADVLESSCDANACTVTVNVGYQVGQPVPGIPKWKSKRSTKERWVKTQGQWWFVPDQ